MRVPANTATIPLPGRSIPAGRMGKAMPMVPKLAYRNLFHDRLSLIVTLVGIVFSVVLVAVQFGIYLGSENRIAAMLDQAKGDLWVVALGTKSFDDPSLLSGRERHAVLSTPGVASVEELAVGFVNWRKPKGGSTAALLVGSEISRGSSLPWNVTQGSCDRARRPVGGGDRQHLFQRAWHQQAGRPRRGQQHGGDRQRRHPGHPLVHHACPTCSRRWPPPARCSCARPTSPPTRL